MRQCNFCGKREDDITVDFFVSNGSTICSECVKNCWELKNKKTRNMDDSNPRTCNSIN